MFSNNKKKNMLFSLQAKELLLQCKYHIFKQYLIYYSAYIINIYI